MLNQLLALYNVRQNYNIGKASGLAGLVAFIVIFLIGLGWDDIIYPLLTTLGIIDVLTESGVINNSDPTGVRTLFNLAALYVGSLLILGILIAIPTVVLMTVLGMAGFLKNAPNPVLFGVGIIFLPFILILTVLFKLLDFIGITKKERNIRTYTNEHPTMKQSLSKTKDLYGNVKEENLLELFAIQEGIVYNELSLNEAHTKINISVKKLSELESFIFGYNPHFKTWHLLLPNPIPFYATEALFGKHNKSPFNVKEHFTNYLGYKVSDESLPIYDFPIYSPTCFTNVGYVKNLNKIVFTKGNLSTATITNLSDLSKFVQLDGEVIRNEFSNLDEYVGPRMIVKRAHVYSYLIPLAYPMENEYYDKGYEFSYYKALENVPNAVENIAFYKDEVTKEVNFLANNGNLWAKQLIEHKNSFEMTYGRD